MAFQRMMFIPVTDFEDCFGAGNYWGRCRPSSQRCQPMRCHNSMELGSFIGLDLARELLLPLLADNLDHLCKGKQRSKLNVDNECRKVCPKWKRWTQEIELPQGFLASHLQDVEVKDGKITLTLRKISSDDTGIQDFTAKRQIELPDDLIESSVKVFAMTAGKMKIVGYKRLNPKDKPESQKREGEFEKSSEKNISDDQYDEKSPPSSEQVSETQVAEEEEREEDNGIVDEFVMLPVDEKKENTTCCKEPEITDESLCEKENEMCCKSSDRDDDCPRAAEQQQPMESDCCKESDETSPRQFKATIQMAPFHPKEITIKLAGLELYIDAVRKDEEEGQLSSFEMHRALDIPKNVNLDQLVTRMSDDGELVITGPYKDKSECERELKIEVEN